MTARGIRNHNPGNLRRTSDPWQGLAEVQSDSEFFTFQAPSWGIRALARTIITYQDRHKLRSVAGLIGRWAPASGDRNGAAPGGEYTQNTMAYIDHVARRVGVGPEEEIDVHRYEIMRPLVEAIIAHENGSQPYTPAQIDKGLVLAGIEPPAKPLASTGTMRGAKVAAAATTATVAVEAAQYADLAVQAGGAIRTLLEFGPIVLGALALVAIGYIAWQRYDDHRRGLL